MSDGWAHFSPDRKYRYLLGRRTGDTRRRILFIMLNPGTADETHNDPTIRRCIGFSERWDYGILEVANLFAFRTSYVKELRGAQEPVGTENDYWLLEALQRADKLVLAWGNHGAFRGRSDEIRRMALKHAKPFHLGLNKTGEPKHPLYLPSSTMPLPLKADILAH